ncbi:type II secretion system F family protein [Blastococcus sp. SYSU D00820]
MTAGVLAALAAALLVWPDRRRRRAADLRPLPPLRLPAVPGAALPAVAGAAAAVAGVLAGPPLVAALAAVGGFAAGRAWHRRRRERDAERGLDALAEALGALAAELRSGRPLEAATTAAAGACPDPHTGRLLARAVRAPAGAPSEGRSEQDRALARVAAGVLLSARTGCSLAAVLGAVEDDLRARRRHREELRVATAGPRASALLLAGLPLLALAMGGGVGADPWGVLTGTATGQVLLLLGVALEAAGLAWTARLLRRAVR